MSRKICPECNGDRLNREALHFFVDGYNIADLCRMDIDKLYQWSQEVLGRLDKRDRKIASEIIKEISTRLQFLVAVGLNYLQLNRMSATLSGGESQRIRLATQLGSELVKCALHPRRTKHRLAPAGQSQAYRLAENVFATRQTP